MAIRGFIIAVENYDPRSQLANLAGVNADALEFLRWLCQVKNVDEVIFCGEPGLALPTLTPPAGGGPTTFVTRFDCDRAGVKAALIDLKSRVNPSVTSELYCYFAGHGFQYKYPTGTADHLVLSGLVNWAHDGDQTLNLDEIRTSFLDGLGFGDQYYFTDACRNPAGGGITPVGTGITFPPFGNSRAAEHRASPIPPGQANWTRNDFAAHLVAGLDGNGKAKNWVGGDMYVLFGRLYDYIFKKTGATGEASGNYQARILKIAPIPACDGAVKVDGLSAGAVIEVDAVHSGMSAMFQVTAPEEPTPSSLLQRDYYDFSATHQGAPLDLIAPAPGNVLDCFEKFEVRFAVPAGSPSSSGGGGGSSGGGAPPSLSLVRFDSDDDTIIHVRDPAHAFTRQGPAPFEVEVPNGAYQVLTLQDKVVVGAESVSVAANPGVTSMDSPVAPDRVRLRDELRARILSQGFGETLHRQGYPEEETGRWDLAQWVAFFGGLVMLPQQNWPMGGHPVRGVIAEARRHGRPAVLILAACENIPGPFRFGLGASPPRATARLEPTADGTGVLYGCSVVPMGPLFCTFQFDPLPPVTLISHADRDFSTVITLTQSPSGHIRIHQYLLPWSRGGPQVVPQEDDLLPVRDFRRSFLAQRRFARGTAVLDLFEPPELTPDGIHGLVENDPILATIAAYDLIRHGSDWRGPDIVGGLIDALNHRPNALPDVRALLKLKHPYLQPPPSLPLLLYGWCSLDLDRRPHEPPVELHDASGLWTSWVGAVEPS